MPLAAAGSYPDAEVAAFLTAVQALVGIPTRLEHEPKAFGGNLEMPAVTLFWVAAIDRRHQTGYVTETTWRWRCNVYVALNEYQPAQRQLRELVPKLLQAVRANPGMGTDDRVFTLLDPGGEPSLDHDEKLLWKTLTLEMVREEAPA